MEDSVKNHADFCTRLFASERRQIAMMAEEKLPSQISLRLFATSRSEMRNKKCVNGVFYSEIRIRSEE